MTSVAIAPQSAESTAPLPAGGPDPHRFDWAEAWYPIAYLDDLDPTQLTRFTLLDRGLVIWWDRNDSAWRVFEDKCPHRLAPLSEGRVNEAGKLECPYHGWAFAGDGTCTHIPQQPAQGDGNLSLRACATALPTAMRQGLLFVYPGRAENASQVEVPIIAPIADEPDGWVMLNTFRDLPYDALTLLENVLDASHIPYTHHKTVGKRENAAPMEMEVLAADKQGFRGLWPEGPRKGKLGTQHTTFIAPALMYHDLTSQQFGRTMTVVYATPMAKGECRLFARFPFKFSSKLPATVIGLTPRWFSHIGNNAVLEDDQIFLHIQERQLEKANQSYAQACYLPTQADRYVLAFRNWVSDYAADPFPGQVLGREWTQAALLDRYHSHTQHCQSCRTALSRLQTLRWALLMVSAVGWSLVPIAVATGRLAGVAAVLLSLVPLGTALAWVGLDILERRFYRGRAVPPRNRPERRSRS
ncbi:Rieske 2Fe-2S domain-containing protein [Nodosilinea sp. LEGE 07088]|uniref:aromatic ring-hydroxylating dioxygenase subunit alpha n=1 Tax=Nodosilinea sp. LEGE 07088 TaxID=2777968 RepID=UPI00188287A7|nr:Rieske 2Fe-2S domain-containing protein [Nodosilinea sp. LEGE 07088]MBE9135749.1 Rieske 2Fe-2S domain-containing protein [Nodosilinea sp. LEGE 07088]